MGKTLYSHNKAYFNIPNLENCYWAGFIAADGNINNDKYYYLKIGLSRVDHFHLEKLKEDISYTGAIKLEHKKIDSGNRYSLFSVLKICGAKSIIKDLNDIFNITPKKSLTLKPPGIFEKDLQLAFVKGLLDGDGNIAINQVSKYRRKGSNGNYYPSLRVRKRSGFTIAGTFEIVSWVYDVLEKHFPGSIGKVKKHSSIYTYSVSGKRAITILYYLNNLNTQCLDRKWKAIRGE